MKEKDEIWTYTTILYIARITCIKCGYTPILEKETLRKKKQKLLDKNIILKAWWCKHFIIIECKLLNLDFTFKI